MVDDLRAILRMAQGRNAEPSAVILDSRTLQSTAESGARAGYDGAKRRKGSKVQSACGGGYFGSPAGGACHSCQRAGQSASATVGRGGAGSDWTQRATGIC